MIECPVYLMKQSKYIGLFYIKLNAFNNDTLYLGEKAIAKESGDYCDVQVAVLKNQTLSASTTKISEYQLYFYPMKGAS